MKAKKTREGRFLKWNKRLFDASAISGFNKVKKKNLWQVTSMIPNAGLKLELLSPTTNSNKQSISIPDKERGSSYIAYFSIFLSKM